MNEQYAKTLDMLRKQKEELKAEVEKLYELQAEAGRKHEFANGMLSEVEQAIRFLSNVNNREPDEVPW